MGDLKKLLFLSAVETFIVNSEGTKVLLLKRAANRKVNPNLIAGIGGKMDSAEIESPIETAYREIFEETGYKKDDIKDIKFRGIITSFDSFGKWNVFEFLVQLMDGKDSIPLIDTNEGKLFWAPTSNLTGLNLIPDLKNDVLEKIITKNEFLWIKSQFDNNDKLISMDIV